jgi:hypothetical protein
MEAALYRKLVWIGLLVLSLSGCSSLLKDLLVPDLPDAAVIQPDAGQADADLSGSGFDTTTLMVTGAEPAYGPYTGNNRIVVRGNGFVSGSSVLIGDTLVSSGDATFVDSHRLSVLVPPGDPGPVDITVKRGAEQATLRHGYNYNTLFVEPDSGSVAGGLLVNIFGKYTRFAEGAAVTFGGEPCTDVAVLSETQISCKTPAMSPGSVDVTVSGYPTSRGLCHARKQSQYAL